MDNDLSSRGWWIGGGDGKFYGFIFSKRVVEELIFFMFELNSWGINKVKKSC